MVDATHTTYRQEATNAYWQRKKSVLDKLAKGSKVTGLGETLTKAQTAFNEINFKILDVGQANGQGGNPWHLNRGPDIDLAKQRAERYLIDKVRPARQAMRLAATQAETIRDNKEKKFTKVTATAAGTVAKALREHEKLLMNIKLNDFDEYKEKKRVSAQLVLNKFEESVVSALTAGDEFVKKVRKTPTAATFNDGIEKPSRKLTQMIGNVDKIKSQGADLNKEQPQDLFERLSPWADRGVRLPPKATSEQVLEEVGKFETIKEDVRRWWG